jgi:hypothetical protein
MSPKYRGRYRGGDAALELRTVGGSVHVGLSEGQPVKIDIDAG